MKDGPEGRRRGQRFPSTAVHDLILFHSIETFPGMRICCKKWETRGEKKMNSEREMMEQRGWWGGEGDEEQMKGSEFDIWGACWRSPKLTLEDNFGLQLQFWSCFLFGIHNTGLTESENVDGDFLYLC